MKKKFLLTGILAAMLFGGSYDAYADKVYTIYPVPQRQVAGEGSGAFTDEVNIVVESGIDEATVSRLKSILQSHTIDAAVTSAAKEGVTNVFLGISGSDGIADKLASDWGMQREVFSKEGKYDRHGLMLKVENGIASVLVLGEHTNATFFGLASLEQMLDGDKSAMPAVAIYDYADLRDRGIVEGYYGYPYSVSVKKDLMHFMMRHKMNTYLYGAKSDPYHSNYWKDDYPATITAEQEKNGWLSQQMVSELSATSADTKVNFIWAIHPGNSFLGSSTAVSDIMGKFDKMYQHGVRQFAVFVDDVGVPSADADLKKNADRLTELQHAIEEKYNKKYASVTDTVRPLHFVPQIYCSSFAPSAEVGRKFFEALSSTPDYVTVYITGAAVWSVPNSGDLATYKNYLGRNLGWWWNYPCNDNADGQIYPSDMYQNFTDMPAVWNNARLSSTFENSVSLVSNPMQQGEVAKTPLFSVADYAWNTAGFDNIASWEASFKAILKDDAAAAAYRHIAPYLRYNEPEQLNSLISSFKSLYAGGIYKPENLLPVLTAISENCDVLIALKDSETESDRLLYTDLAPWLLKLKAMSSAACNMIELMGEQEVDDVVWNKYVESIKVIESLETDTRFKAYALEGMGTSISTSENQVRVSERYLRPFVNYLKETVLAKYFSGKRAKKASFFGDTETPLNVLVTNNVCYVHTLNKVHSIPPASYVGIELPQPVLLADVTVADTLVANYAVVYSRDGRKWKRYSDKESMLSDFVKYVCIQNKGAVARTLRLNRTIFSVTLPSPTTLDESATSIPDGAIWQNHGKELITDGDYSTFVCLNRNQQNNDAYTVKLAQAAVVGDVRICMGTVNGDYMTEGRVEVSADGRSWKALNIKGTHTPNFTMSHRAVVKYSDEMSYCDFTGIKDEVLYVRLRLSTANTSKWCRLYEIEVNKQTDAGKYLYDCTDGDGKLLPEAIDELPYTSVPVPASSMIYNINNAQPLKKITIYQDASLNAAATVAVCDDDVWSEVGPLSAYCQEVDLTGLASCSAVKISWTGETAPVIYEITEEADPDRKPEVTRIEQVGVSGDNGLSLQISGRNIVVNATEGIKQVQLAAVDGRTLFSAKTGGARQFVLPQPSAVSGIYILNVVLSNGQRTSYKVYTK